MKKELLHINDLMVRHGKREVVSYFSTRVDQGEIVYILGQAGSGKTTICDVLRGHTSFQEGFIRYEGNLVQSGDTSLGLKGIHFIGQQHMLVDRFSVAENMNLYPGNQGRWLIRKGKEVAKVQSVLKEFGLDIDPYQKTYTLDNYEKHLIEMIMSVVRKSRLIIIDDIFKAYGGTEQREIYRLIGKLHKKGLAILLFGRKPEPTDLIINRIHILNKGKCLRTFFEGNVDEREVMACINYGSEDIQKWKSPLEEGDENKSGHMEVDLPLKSEGRALRVHVESGEVVGVLDSERIFDNRSLEGLLDKGWGYIPNIPIKAMLIPEMSAYDNLVLQIHRRMSPYGILSSSLKKFLIGTMGKETIIPSKTWNQPVQNLLEYEQLIVLYGRWLFKRPPAIVLMEPYMGADELQRKMLKDMIKEFSKQGTGVIIISAEERQIDEVSNRIVRADKNS